MATIDLIVLGMLKKGSMGAYDIQKLVEYRNISKWVKISTQSIYKKALQLEEKGFITAEREFERLMMDISAQPIRLFLDFNAVIVNLDSLPPEAQAGCISQIEKNINELTENLKENYRQKEDAPEVPETGMAVLRQQLVLAQALEGWIAALKEHFSSL